MAIGVAFTRPLAGTVSRPCTGGIGRWVPGVLATSAAVRDGGPVLIDECRAPSRISVARRGLDHFPQCRWVDDLASGLAGHGGPAIRGSHRHEEVDLGREWGTSAGPSRARRAERPRPSATTAVPAILVGF